MSPLRKDRTIQTIDLSLYAPFVPLYSTFFGRKEEAVSTGLISNSLEFGGIKMRVVGPLPDSEE